MSLSPLQVFSPAIHPESGFDAGGNTYIGDEGRACIGGGDGATAT